jgi:negative regulator of sigma-B (phosphoserine phosphatase)
MERIVEFGVAMRPLPGESICGDVHVAAPLARGLLVAAVDGIGHGAEAASAARLAASILEEHAEEPVIALLMRCHRALHAGRGAVMSIAAIDAQRGLITWLGVGNVIGTLLHRAGSHLTEEDLLLRAGVVGGPSLPALQAEVVSISPGDTLVLATDGIASAFSRNTARNLPPQRAAESILERHARVSDDALVLVTRLR